MMGIAGVLGAAQLCRACAIHGSTVENTSFEDGDGANAFRAYCQRENTVNSSLDAPLHLAIHVDLPVLHMRRRVTRP